MNRRLSFFLSCLLAMVALPASADVTGTVTVINGNTLEMQGQFIRLYGVDALDRQQVCRNGNNRLWPCGQQSIQALRQAIGGSPLRCEPLSRNNAGQIVAICKRSGDDINAWMISRGWAVADRTSTYDYLGAEQSAQSAGTGIWSSDFVMPILWRNGKRLGAPSTEETPSENNLAPQEDWGPMPLNNGP